MRGEHVICKVAKFANHGFHCYGPNECCTQVLICSILHRWSLNDKMHMSTLLQRTRVVIMVANSRPVNTYTKQHLRSRDHLCMLKRSIRHSMPKIDANRHLKFTHEVMLITELPLPALLGSRAANPNSSWLSKQSLVKFGPRSYEINRQTSHARQPSPRHTNLRCQDQQGAIRTILDQRQEDPKQRYALCQQGCS